MEVMAEDIVIISFVRFHSASNYRELHWNVAKMFSNNVKLNGK